MHYSYYRISGNHSQGYRFKVKANLASELHPSITIFFFLTKYHEGTGSLKPVLSALGVHNVIIQSCCALSSIIEGIL